MHVCTVDVLVLRPFAACLPVAQMAAVWDKPLVTWLARSNQLDDKMAYPTLARTMASFSKMGVFMADVFHQCGWKRVGLLTSQLEVSMTACKRLAFVFDFERNSCILGLYSANHYAWLL